MSTDTYVPFCGIPPTPDALWSRWLFDPALLAVLALLLLPVMTARQYQKAGLAGWALVAVLFISPLCALSMSLFSARVAQHLLMTLVAAPLLARILPAVGHGPVPAAVIFAALFWFWHAPDPYAATLASDWAYWAMHLSLLGGAVVFWSETVRAVAIRPFAAFLGVALTAGQMTGLATLYVFAARPWHAWHGLTTEPWGLTALADQALAGALMWLAGALLTAIAIWWLVAGFFRSHDTDVSSVTSVKGLTDGRT